jgi:hypothetical protein
MKKLRADLNHGMLAVVQCRIFVLGFAIQKYKDQYTVNYKFVCCFVLV